MANQDPTALQVASRLARLRELCPIERDSEARDRLRRERPSPAAESFEVAVARRLAELRALCELTRYLHRGRPGR
jgi:hypothetical protein